MSTGTGLPGETPSPSAAPTSPGDRSWSVHSIETRPERLVAWQSLRPLGKEFLHPPRPQGQVGPQSNKATASQPGPGAQQGHRGLGLCRLQLKQPPRPDWSAFHRPRRPPAHTWPRACDSGLCLAPEAGELLGKRPLNGT